MNFGFLSGATAMASIVIAIFFFHFYKKVQDRFFMFMSIAFALFALEKTANNIYITSEGEFYMVYIIRFIGFLVIVAGILDKNRKERA